MKIPEKSRPWPYAKATSAKFFVAHQPLTMRSRGGLRTLLLAFALLFTVLYVISGHTLELCQA